MSHAVVPLAARFGLGPAVISRRLLWVGVLASMAPDSDVYLRHVFDFIDHRGITHSLVFAFALALVMCAFARVLQTKPVTAFLFIFIATASHGVLDAFTTGGGAIAFFWPFTDERYFMPVQMIEVSPIGITSFFSKRGLVVLGSEIVWVWSFAVVAALAMYFVRKSD
jgi:inner membrane protein